MKKRLLAIIIAAVMVASLLPASLVSANDSGSTTVETTIKYDISAFMNARSYRWNESGPWLRNMTYDSTNNLFAFVSAPIAQDVDDGSASIVEGINTYNGNNRNSNLTVANGNTGRYLQLNGNITFKINVPVAGKYKLDIEYMKPAAVYANGIVSVFITETAITDFSTATPLGKYSTVSAGTLTEDTVRLKTDTTSETEAEIELEKGEYYLAFKSGNYGYVGSVALVSENKSVLNAIKATEDEILLIPGSVETAKIGVESMYMSDASAVSDMSAYTVSYVSSNSEVAKVSDDGTVTAVSAGTAQITVKATNEVGTVVSDSVEVVVENGNKILYNLGEDMYSLGMTWLSNDKSKQDENGLTPFDKRPSVYELNYTSTKGFYKVHSAKTGINSETGQTDDNFIKYTNINKNGRFQVRGTSWFAIEIYVPTAGTYDLEMYSYEESTATYDCETRVYISDKAAILDDANCIGSYNVYNADAGNESVTKKVGTKTFDAPGEYIATFVALAGNSKYTKIDGFALVGGTNNALIGGEITSTADSINKDEDETATVSASGYLSKTAEAASFTYSSNNEDIATVDENSGVVTGVSVGTATITATCADAKYGGVLTKTIKVTQNEDTEITQAFTPAKDAESTIVPQKATVSALAAYIGGEKNGNEVLSITSPSVGSELATVSAPDVEGYNFLYWAKGNSAKRQVLSYTKSFTFKPTVETNYIIAVYAAADGAGDNKAEFYNANGQLIEVKTSGNTPALPFMAGYGETGKWALYGTNETYAADAEIEYSGTKIFVAKYDNIKNFAITVDGAEDTYNYGDKVECRTTVPQGKVFKAWAKTVNGKSAEIVSLNPEYDFYAWEACTVTPIFADAAAVYSGSARKIILGTFSVGGKTAYMAEFIGLEGAVEKGIMLGSTKLPMATDGTQFTVTDDTLATEAYGYAILSDGTVFFDK